MISVTVELGQRSYPIHIGAGLLTGRLLTTCVPARQVMVVTDTCVAPLYLQRTLAALNDRPVASLVLPDGEQHKTLQTMERIISELLRQRFGRDAVLVALGGGVIGDVTGFAAAVYQRGIDFVQIPTTLLAQVDSSVGGKTAVNHALGKNMIGAFHQPLAVVSDIDTLATLAPREFCAGLAEIIKYGLIHDAGFFQWLRQNTGALVAGDPAVLIRAIDRSCRIKAEIVAVDERESGLRAILNLGHTFGHAIETGLGYGVWLHGEAVAAGMCMAADMSRRLGWLGAQDLAGIIELVAACGLPTHAPAALTADMFLEHMALDKKVRAGQLRLVLLQNIGSAVVTADYPRSVLLETLQAARQVADVA